MSSPSLPVDVRPAQEAEAGLVAWLAAATFPVACPAGTDHGEMARHVAAHLAPAHFRQWVSSLEHRLLVAVRGSGEDVEVLGYSLLHYGEPDGATEAAVLAEVAGAGPYVELSKIYAHPLAMGTGTSSALMAASVSAAASLAAAHGHERALPLWLGTNAQNLRAQAFYRKHGFVVVGARTYDVGGQLHDDVVMLHRP